MKIAIITGASSGLGKEFARQLDDKGLDEIWIIARREDRLKQLEMELLTPVHIFSFDLSKEESFTIFEHYLSQEKPFIKYLINAAGFGVFARSDQDLEIISKMIDVNIKALVYMSYLCIPYMDIGSHIIQLGSSSSFTPLENFNIYASTKAFVVHFSQGLYKELNKSGIKVTVICPSWVKTEFFKHANHDLAAHAPRFTLPMYKSKYVVAKAIQDAHLGKMISVPGFINKTHFVLSKILPKKVLMHAWHLIQK